MKVRLSITTEEGLEKVLYWKFKSKQQFFTWIGRTYAGKGIKGISYRELK